MPTTEPHADRPLAGHLDDEQYDRLVLLALGETAPGDPALEAHAAACPECRAEVWRLERVVALGRDGPELRQMLLARPGPQVWEAIAREVGLTADPAPLARPARARRLRRTLLAAAVMVVLAGGVGAGFATVRHHASTRASATVPTSGALSPVAAGPAGSRGTVSVVATPDGMRLRVRVGGLPNPAGFYEVWLYDPTTGRMVAIGMLGEDERGDYLMPSGLDLRLFHVVDISVQHLDGDPSHGNSVLRGALP